MAALSSGREPMLSSRSSAKISLVGVFPCLPLINMYKGRVYDVTHCYNLGKKVSPSIYNEVDRFTNERHATTIGTIGLPRLARKVT